MNTVLVSPSVRVAVEAITVTLRTPCGELPGLRIDDVVVAHPALVEIALVVP